MNRPIAMNQYPLLSALMAPCPAEVFLAEHWPLRAFVAHGPPTRLPAMLQHPLLSKPNELAQRYKGRVRFTHGHSERMVQVADVIPAELLDMGMTVQYVDLGDCVPSASTFMRTLEAELGLHEGAVSITAFSSPRDDGLPRHYDAQELISVQLQGSKRFRYAPMREIRNPYGWQFTPMGADYDELYPQAAGGFPDPANASFETADLQPGSVLFLPRGTWHHTEASENSLSVSIAIDPPPALQCLLDQLRCLLLQDADWRQPLYGACGSQRYTELARAHANRLLASLPAAVARIAADDLLRSPSNVQRRLESIAPTTRFQRVSYAHLDFMPRANGVYNIAVRFGQRQNLTQVSTDVDVPNATAAVFRWLEAQTHGAFSAAALQSAFPDAPFSALKDILTLCVKAQFLKLLWFPALDPLR